jgi:hypothetical protein
LHLIGHATAAYGNIFLDLKFCFSLFRCYNKPAHHDQNFSSLFVNYAIYHLSLHGALPGNIYEAVYLIELKFVKTLSINEGNSKLHPLQSHAFENIFNAC